MQTNADLRRVICAATITISLLVPSFFCEIFGQISISALNNPVSENFNFLAAPTNPTGTLLPNGWVFLETSTNHNTSFSVNNGSSTTGDTYSYGPATGSNTGDRALGSLQSNSLIPSFGASFQNNTGSTITQLTISYTGEYWRCGAINRPDNDILDFSMSSNATSIETGSWTDYNELDFNNGNLEDCPSSVGAKDGNTCKKAITYTIQNLSISNGSVFFIRWVDKNATNADDGMAVDDFSLNAYNVNGNGTGSNLFIYDNVNSLVGLGKTPLVTPAIKFDVNGNLRTTGRLFVGVPVSDDNGTNNKLNRLLQSSENYILAVNGTALVTRLVVKKYSSWPDYVFDKGYKLMSLPALTEYIYRNKHLPAVPSASDMKKEGIDVGNIQAVMLRKIEELTLYIIEQQKQIQKRIKSEKQQQVKLEYLEKEVKWLLTQVNK